MKAFKSPYVYIEAVEDVRTNWPNGDTTVAPKLILACGHVVFPAAHFSYVVHGLWRCYECEKTLPHDSAGFVIATDF